VQCALFVLLLYKVSLTDIVAILVYLIDIVAIYILILSVLTW